jgi:hypothetical protein
MEKNKKQKKTNLLWKISITILFISGIMIVIYISNFFGWLSDDTEDWGNFGSYLGSITGLLAFSGVLFTASLSEKRADEEKGRREQAEKQAIMRDERDQFFKMLELYKEQISAVKDKEKTGIEAFETYRSKANDSLMIYIILKGLIDLDITKIDKNKESMDLIKYSLIVALKKISNGVEVTEYCNKCVENREFDSLYSLPQATSAISYFDFLEKSMSSKDRYLAMKYVGDLIYDKYGHYLGQYFRTICHLQNMIVDNIEREKYIAIFRSQLSRYELVLLLYNVVSSQIEPEVAQMFVDNEIFKNIFPEDVLGCKYKVDQEKDKDKQRKIVNDFIRNLVLIKAEESKKTSKN